MSSPPSQIRLREARKEEIPLLVSMLINAFRGRAMNEAFFPERLRVREGDADQLSFRSERMEKQYAARDEARQADPDEKRPQCHYLVAVEVLEEEGSGSSPEGGEETIVGYAEWVGHRGAAPAPNSKESGDKAAAAAQPGLTEEERAEEEEKKKEKKRKREAERIAALPPSLDREAVDTAQKETAVLEGTLKEALGEEGFANSWCKYSPPPFFQMSTPHSSRGSSMAGRPDVQDFGELESITQRYAHATFRSLFYYSLPMSTAGEVLHLLIRKHDIVHNRSRCD